jgi:Zn-dependent metalloprotease
MKRTLRYIAFMVAVSSASLAQPATETKPLRPAPHEAAGIDSEPSPAKLTSRTPSRVYSGDKSDAARAYLSEHKEILAGIDIDSLVPLDSRQIGSRAYVRLQQQIDGIPIRGANIILRIGAANTVTTVQSRLAPRLIVQGKWKLNAAEAASRATSTMRPNATPRTEQLFLRRNSRAIPVWRVLFRSGNPAGDWEILVSADDGSIISRKDLRIGAHALGNAYPKNPVTGEVERVTLENLASDTHLTSEQTKVFTYFPALHAQVAPGTVVQGATRQNDNFLYGTDDARFSEVQLYYGMETANARFQSLGFWGFDAPLPGVVLFQDYDEEQKRFVGADNAFFSPIGFGDHGGMFFYLTSRQGDTSLDTDVIYHEYSHAVINELVGSDQSEEFKALNEGSADYFSSSFLDDPVMAEYAARIFNARSGFLRRTDNSNRWPYNVVGESHADGNIWSGALWDVRSRLGAGAADEIAINALAMLTPDAEFFDAATAAITAAEEFYGSNAADVVAEVMQSRGIYTSAARTASRSITLTSGETADGRVSATAPGQLLVGAQQYRIDVPNRATRLSVRVEANAAIRFYLRYRVPITIEDGQIAAEQVSATGVSVGGYLSIDNRPELQAGTYYIAIVNIDTSPAAYTVKAEIEGGDPAASPAVTLLENGATADGSVPSGPFLASRQFAVQVPEGTGALAITLEGDQDVDLYVRAGRPVYITGAGFPEADVVSDSPSSREDLRVVSRNGGTLPAGTYYIGVYNYGSESARFVVRARYE